MLDWRHHEPDTSLTKKCYSNGNCCTIICNTQYNTEGKLGWLKLWSARQMWQLKTYQVIVVTLTQLLRGLRKRVKRWRGAVVQRQQRVVESTKTRKPEVRILKAPRHYGIFSNRHKILQALSSYLIKHWFERKDFKMIFYTLWTTIVQKEVELIKLLFFSLLNFFFFIHIFLFLWLFLTQ